MPSIIKCRTTVSLPLAELAVLNLHVAQCIHFARIIAITDQAGLLKIVAGFESSFALLAVMTSSPLSAQGWYVAEA